ncbi:phosphotransferase family protein [Phytohabitans sp. ZYX-F-186]|uniref:Phosphotransferase family protein n=1 Tax=Phytohabitans maris TaxID=3071409 RepID=A0ABU0ZBJ3_9ACTN|nr:phosphotransferase family protein [Phytohabitans sp. ZYX-F-186]MDQ7903726.1 phosphotransferase family protein [Phytohabitans sp. ZYX-F-186]
MHLTADQLAPLTARLDDALAAHLPGNRLERLDPLPGGASSLTFVARLAGSPRRAGGDPRIVVKVAPPGLEPVRNRDVLRQAGLLRRLARLTALPVPEVLFEVTGDGPARPPFFAMGFVEGESVEPILDPVEPPPTPLLATRWRSAAALLAELHRARAEDLAPGEPAAVDLAAEVGRWARALESVPERMRPGARECGAALLATVPSPARPAVLHGDFRLGNMLCRGAKVAAVIDWEIWSIGDPRVDLAWTRTFTHPDRLPTAVRAVEGLPTADEVQAIYEGAAGSYVTEMTWFDALARFKQAAVTALIVKHNARRAVPDPFLAGAGPAVARSIADARRLLA